MNDPFPPRAGRRLFSSLSGPIGLVSTSPRRAALLEQVRIPFRVVHHDADEEAPEEPGRGAVAPEELAVRLAERKVRSVAGEKRSPDLLLAADTIVVKEGRILGKPAAPEEARRMLASLSGGWHSVVTGVVVLDRRRGRRAAAAARTRVLFRDLEEEMIGDYVATGEPMDKAGAYGIQGIGALLVERIEGCYSNVVGLPLVLTMRLLDEVLHAADR